jgi:hypothetical protein
MATLAEVLRQAGYVTPQGQVVGPRTTTAQTMSNYIRNIIPNAAQNLAQQRADIDAALTMGDQGIQVGDRAAFERQMAQVPNLMGSTNLTRKELLKQKLDENLPTIQINDKTIPVTIHKIEAKEGNKLVNVNPATFDEAFKQTDWQYIGKNAEGGKPERIAGVQKYLETGKPMNASNAVVKDNGTIVFGDGRHRYAVLRDMGLGKIPMSMDEKSIQNAKKFGYID